MAYQNVILGSSETGNAMLAHGKKKLDKKRLFIFGSQHSWHGNEKLPECVDVLPIT